MKKILFILSIIFFLTCKSNLKPIVFRFEEVKFFPLESSEKSVFIKLKVSSKDDLLKIYKEENAANIYMYCPLASGNFENINKDSIELYGFLNKDSLTLLNNKYYYEFPIYFSEGGKQVIKKNEIFLLLKNKECLDCKIIMAFNVGSLKTNHFFEKFCIPTDSLLNSLK